MCPEKKTSFLKINYFSIYYCINFIYSPKTPPFHDVPILVVNCSDEFETNQANKDKLLLKVTNFLRKIEFLDDDEEFEPVKEKQSSSSTLKSVKSVEEVKLDVENKENCPVPMVAVD